jgi:RimJ/RimL family protein N-acetyltransferase
MLPPTPVLETLRLILRPLRLDDAPTIQRRFPHWEVVRHLSADIPWPYPADGAAHHVAERVAEMARGEKLHWAITLKGAGDE